MEDVTGRERATGVDTTTLVARAQAGDPAALGALFRAHVGRIHRLVYRLVGPSGDIDDLVQTVFVEGFRSLPAFRGESLFTTWLGRIAVRTTMRSLKRPAPRLVPLDEAAPLADRRDGPDLRADARDGLARLDRMLAAMSAKRRAAFVLHVLEGYSLEEVAVMVGARVGAVKVRIHDARRELEREARNDPWFARWFSEEAAP
jgi:RNA polymerase sigma-70 factor (ECF subfamily)